ncbi:MAG TPA: hypothetical protein VMI53_14845 [Opitutaceae bacterium]|nr:hypothetical protein [Opitutaceae bacterium]
MFEQTFKNIDDVLWKEAGQYVSQGVEELDQDKLSHLLELKYHTIDDAAAQLDELEKVRDSFVGFQQYLYADDKGI